MQTSMQTFMQTFIGTMVETFVRTIIWAIIEPFVETFIETVISVDRGGNVTIEWQLQIVVVSMSSALFHVYIVSFLRRSIYTRVLLL